LRARRQFLEIYAKGRRVSSSSITLFALPGTHECCRLGITVTRKVGGAVVRNRVKRVLRDVFRRHRTELRPGLDLVINAHRSITERTTSEIEQDFLRGVARLQRGRRR
jgi:ribonuclease P protein component